MVLDRAKKILSGAFFFSLITIMFSCEEMLPVDCEECTANEPMEIYLLISTDEVQSGAEVSIYEGFIEDSVLLHRYKTYSLDSFYKVPLNKSYTLSAKYIRDGKTYIVITSITPGLRYEESQCSEPCYYVYDRKIDLRLDKL
jgi:hypothetical protein